MRFLCRIVKSVHLEIMTSSTSRASACVLKYFDHFARSLYDFDTD